MNKIKKLGYSLLALAPLASYAEGGSTSSVEGALSDVTTTLGTLATSIGGLLVAALGIYAGFVAYRKVRESLNKA